MPFKGLFLRGYRYIDIDIDVDIDVDLDALLGDLVSRLSNWPYGACYGLFLGLTWDTKWTKTGIEM